MRVCMRVVVEHPSTTHMCGQLGCVRACLCVSVCMRVCVRVCMRAHV